MIGAWQYSNQAFGKFMGNKDYCFALPSFGLASRVNPVCIGEDSSGVIDR
jgi:hypothetical protein